MKRRRKYTKEFKISVVRDLENRKTMAEVCREYELNASTVTKWKQQYRKDPERAFQGNGKAASESARIAELERLVGQLFSENAFLKKTLSTLENRLQELRNKGGQS
jgi:transposase